MHAASAKPPMYKEGNHLHYFNPTALRTIRYQRPDNLQKHWGRFDGESRLRGSEAPEAARAWPSSGESDVGILISGLLRCVVPVPKVALWNHDRMQKL